MNKSDHHYKIYYRYNIMDDNTKFVDITAAENEEHPLCDLYEYGYSILKQKHPSAYISEIFSDGEEFVYTKEDTETFIQYLALRQFMNDRKRIINRK